MKKIFLILVLLVTVAASTFADHYSGYVTQVRATFDNYNYTNWIAVSSKVNFYTNLNEIDVTSDINFNAYYSTFTVDYSKSQEFKYSYITNVRYSNYNLITLTGNDTDGKNLTVFLYIYDDSSALVYYKYSNIMYEYLINKIYLN